MTEGLKKEPRNPDNINFLHFIQSFKIRLDALVNMGLINPETAKSKSDFAYGMTGGQFRDPIAKGIELAEMGINKTLIARAEAIIPDKDSIIAKEQKE